MAGRPTKLTLEIIEEAEKYLQLGNYETVVAKYLGVQYKTWVSWKQRGKKGDNKLFSEFYTRVSRALTGAEIYAVTTLRQAMLTDWRAADAYLQRRYPERWGKSRLEHTGKNGTDLSKPETHVHINVGDLGKLKDDELELYRRIASRGETPSERGSSGGGNGAGETPA